MQLLLFGTSNANSKFKGGGQSEGKLEFLSLQPCTCCPGHHRKSWISAVLTWNRWELGCA